MDWRERANATEERLHGLFVAALAGDAQAYEEFLSALASHLLADCCVGSAALLAREYCEQRLSTGRRRDHCAMPSINAQPP